MKGAKIPKVTNMDSYCYEGSSSDSIQTNKTSQVGWLYYNNGSSSGGGDDENGIFTLKTSLLGNTKDTYSDNFKFYVLFTDLTPGNTYYYGAKDYDDEDISFNADSSGNAEVAMELAEGEEVSFKKLKYYSKYRIIEEAGDFIAAYKITNENDPDNWDTYLIEQNRGSNSVKNMDLKTALEQVDEYEDITVEFINTRYVYENITVKNIIENAAESNNDSFDFVIDFEGLDLGESS